MQELKKKKKVEKNKEKKKSANCTKILHSKDSQI